MDKADVGLAGLTSLGRNLALVLARHAYSVAVFDDAFEASNTFTKSHTKGLDLRAVKSLGELVGGVKPPRRILLAFDTVGGADKAVQELAQSLQPGDMVLDCGDSFFEHTARREKVLSARGIRYLGVGLVPGVQGAGGGFCVMPGGARDILPATGRLFTDIAFRVDGSACFAWIGPEGSGHFVKAVHDGIQSACMQLIGESYALMRGLLRMSAEEAQAIFRLWNTREQASHLIQITRDILGNQDIVTERALVDVIQDDPAPASPAERAGMQALLAGVPVPTLVEAAFMRSVSTLKSERMIASRQIEKNVEIPDFDRYAFLDDLGQALHAATISAYAQGFALLRAVSQEHGWNLKPTEIATVWSGGALRSDILRLAGLAMGANPLLQNLMLAPAFRTALEEAQPAWRRIAAAAALGGVPAPCIGSALAFFDSYFSAELPANLLQAQLNFLNGQPYRRTDMPGDFHTEWRKE